MESKLKLGDIVKAKYWDDDLLAIVTDDTRANTTGIIGVVFIGEEEYEYHQRIEDMVRVA